MHCLLNDDMEAALFLFWRQGRVQQRRLYSLRCSTDRLLRTLHQTAFTSSTDDNITERKSGGPLLHAHQRGREREAVGGITKYSSLMEAAKTQSQLSNREQFALVLKEFMSREKYRKGHVTFITMALERMEEFKLEKDLLTYNRLLDVFPKGRYHPKRLLDALWPRTLPQCELALELLTRMEDNGIWPDAATYSLLVEVFGKHSLPVDKCERMFYWYARYKDADPYWIDGDLPEDLVELSRLALNRIVNNDSIIEHKCLSVSDDKSSGFILSGHTSPQLQMLDKLSSSIPDTTSSSILLYVEGPCRIWINKTAVEYFTLRLSARDSGIFASDGEGAVAAVCLCQPQSQSSLQQWIKELQLAYPYFRDATIVYNIKTANNTTSNLLDTSHSTPKSISGT